MSEEKPDSVAVYLDGLPEVIVARVPLPIGPNRGKFTGRDIKKRIRSFDPKFVPGTLYSIDDTTRTRRIVEDNAMFDWSYDHCLVLGPTVSSEIRAIFKHEEVLTAKLERINMTRRQVQKANTRRESEEQIVQEKQEKDGLSVRFSEDLERRQG